jgi:hypothetical protein
LRAFRYQSDNIGYWRVNEERSTCEFNFFFSYYILDYAPFRNALLYILGFPELNPESYTIEQVVNKILQNDFLYYSNLYERVKAHYIFNIPDKREYFEKEFGQLIRELCLEDVRKNKFSYCPSRQKCLFCVPDYKGLDYWYKLLLYDKNDFQLVELSLDGKTFIGDNSYLQNYTNNIDDYYQYVTKYWMNPLNEASAESEIIFQGTARCIRIVQQKSIIPFL